MSSSCHEHCNEGSLIQTDEMFLWWDKLPSGLDAIWWPTNLYDIIDDLSKSHSWLRIGRMYLPYYLVKRMDEKCRQEAELAGEEYVAPSKEELIKMWYDERGGFVGSEEDWLVDEEDDWEYDWKAKRRVERAKRRVGSAKRRVGRAERRLGRAKRRVDGAKRRVGKAKRRAGRAKVKFDRVREDAGITIESDSPYADIYDGSRDVDDSLAATRTASVSDGC